MKFLLCVLCVVGVLGLSVAQQPQEQLDHAQFSPQVEYTDHLMMETGSEAGVDAGAESASTQQVFDAEEAAMLAQDPALAAETEQVMAAAEDASLMELAEAMTASREDTAHMLSEAQALHSDAQSLLSVESDEYTLSPEEQKMEEAEAAEDAREKAEAAAEAAADAKEEAAVRALEKEAISVGVDPATVKPDTKPATSEKKPVQPVKKHKKSRKHKKSSKRKSSSAPRTQDDLIPDATLLSPEQVAQLAAHLDATASVSGALSNFNELLSAKDETIRRLIGHVAKLTASVGKLAAKNDVQASIIDLLKSKLEYANARNAELDEHVAGTDAVVRATRKALVRAARNLAQQSKHTRQLTHFLARHADKTDVPAVGDANLRLSSSGRKRLHRLLRSLPGDEPRRPRRKHRSRRFASRRPAVWAREVPLTPDVVTLVASSPQPEYDYSYQVVNGPQGQNTVYVPKLPPQSFAEVEAEAE